MLVIRAKGERLAVNIQCQLIHESTLQLLNIEEVLVSCSPVAGQKLE